MLGDDTWSVRRLANRCGAPETSVRRMVGELEAAGIAVTGWGLNRAVIGIRAYRGGHTKDAIAVIGDLCYIGSTCWLVSGEQVAQTFSTLLQATAFIEDHPHGTYHLSPLAAMGLEAVAS